MPIVTTNLGLQAIANADAGGFWVDLDHFALTEASQVNLDVSDTALVGTPVFTALIQSVVVIGASSVELTLFVPRGVPTAGTWNLYELGLYLKTGDLFAHGTFKVPYQKSTDFGLKVKVIVTAARLGEVINVTISNVTSLSSTASVSSLPAPNDYDTNVVIVQDQNATDSVATDLATAGLALRYGAGGLRWAFVGHTLVYHGVVVPTSGLKFGLDIHKEGGFWLNDGEQVLLQVTAGAASGASRKAKWDEATLSFSILDTPLPINALSQLQIWRDPKNALPTRDATVPSYYVLGAGTNTWSETVPETAGLTEKVQHQFSSTAGGAIYTLPAPVAPAVMSDPKNYMVFVSGKRLSFGAFAVSGLTVTLATQMAVGTEVVVVYFVELPSTGAILTYAVADYALSTPGRTNFSLPMLPKDVANILVFADSLLVFPSRITYAGSSITISGALAQQTVTLMVSASFYEPGSVSTLYQASQVLAAGSTTMLLGSELDPKNTLVTSDGQRLAPDQYTAANASLVFTASAEPRNIAVFTSTSATVPYTTTGVKSGTNTGPLWQDPAGVSSLPNRLEPRCISVVSDGISPMFAIPPGVPNMGHVLVFVGGVLQSPSTLRFNPSITSVTLGGTPRAGLGIDIVYFVSLPDPGKTVACAEQTIATTASDTYTLSASIKASAWPPLAVILGGVYQHRSTYVYIDGVLTFSEPTAPGLALEVWSYDETDAPGSCCSMSVSESVVATGQTDYVHLGQAVAQGAVTAVTNSAVFLGSIEQSRSAYTVSGQVGEAPSFHITPLATDVGLPVVTVALRSGTAATRLLTRAEVEANYVTRSFFEVKMAELVAQFDLKLQQALAK